MTDPASSLTTQNKGSWVRWVLLGAGGLFALGVPVNLVNGDLPNALVGALISGLGVGGFLFITQNQKARARFLAWLSANAAAVRAGGAVWEGQTVTEATVLKTYDVAVSMLIVSTRFMTRFVLAGDPAEARIKWVATAVSILLGPWGIPFGPIFSIQALVKNLRGGHAVPLSALLAAAPVKQ